MPDPTVSIFETMNPSSFRPFPQRFGEILCLADRVISNQCFCDLQHQIRSGEVDKLLERCHELSVCVRSTCSINQNNLIIVGGSECYCIFGHIGSILAVSPFVDIDRAEVFSLSQFFQVAYPM